MTNRVHQMAEAQGGWPMTFWQSESSRRVAAHDRLNVRYRTPEEIRARQRKKAASRAIIAVLVGLLILGVYRATR